MWDTIKDTIQNFFSSRLVPISIVYILLFSILIGRLFQLQIVEGESYSKESEKKGSHTREIKATRGNIYDCNGKLLAYNELSYNVTFEVNDTTKHMTSEESNAMIYRLLQILEKNKETLSVEFYIEKNKKGNFVYTLSGNSLLRFKKEAYSKQSLEELTQERRDISAEDLFQYLRFATDSDSPKFNISEEYDEDTALQIMTVRYAMFMNRFKQYQPITLATDVSEKTVAAIKENIADLPGIDISEDTTRTYNDSEYFAHILGYTGGITTERLEELQEKDPNTNYTSSDQIGISGIESSFENYLKGTKGSELLRINESTGRVITVQDQTDPVAGNDLYLSIDSELQKECYNLLEEHIAGILISKINNSPSAGSRGDSAEKIRIPIYDVYNALIQNNVIDVSRFTDKDASSLEKATHKRYKQKAKDITKRMRKYLAADSNTTYKDLSDDMGDFVTYFYTALKNEGIVLTDEIDTTDSTYRDYLSGKVSLSRYLQYAISENWIDLSALKIGESYFSTEEIYEKLLDYGFKNILEDDTTFIKMVYSYLIYHYEISGRDCCLLLFDQGDIKYNAEEYRNVKLGMTDPYNFLMKKIRNLEITPGQLGLDPCSGSLIVTDVNTGQVKAMVSYPSYDNNKMANQVDSDYFYSYLTQNTSSPLLNRPTQQKLAPGSTFKIVSAVAGLEEGVITTGQTIHDQVKFDKINPPYPHCWNKSGHGSINVSGAIEGSCNYFFYEVGYQLSGLVKGSVNNNKGLAKLKKYANMFGLTDKSGVEIQESSPNFSESDSVRSAIGQASHSYTPIQLSRYVTTVANSGKCYDLTLINQIRDVDGKIVLDNKAKLRNKISISGSTWNAVHEGMYRVVNNSSISSMYESLKVKVAGKTGTAQQSKLHANHAYFISYAPYNDPEISVTCAIPNGFTSHNAAQTARDVYKYYFSKNHKKVSGKVKMPESDATHTD